MRNSLVKTRLLFPILYPHKIQAHLTLILAVNYYLFLLLDVRKKEEEVALHLTFKKPVMLCEPSTSQSTSQLL